MVLPSFASFLLTFGTDVDLKIDHILLAPAQGRWVEIALAPTKGRWAEIIFAPAQGRRAEITFAPAQGRWALFEQRQRAHRHTQELQLYFTNYLQNRHANA